MCWAGGRIEDHMAHKSPGCSSYYDLSRVARPAVACGQVKRVVDGARRSTSFELEQVRQTAREGLGRRVRGPVLDLVMGAGTSYSLLVSRETAGWSGTSADPPELILIDPLRGTCRELTAGTRL